jgi:hypothetical protein
LVAAAALAPVLQELPDGVVTILYVDDFAIFATSKAAAVHIKNTLGEALWAAPVGDLQLKFWNIHHVVDGLGFLGYHIFRNNAGGGTARPRQAAFERVYSLLEAVDAGGFPNPTEAKKARFLSWRCSYAAWDGDPYGDDLLFVILSNHFPSDLDELIQLAHACAQKAKLKSLPD